MKQLEQRFYERNEIAELTSVDPEDSKHFKRNVESVLSKWGYGYDWLRSGVTITSIPDTKEAQLQEILIRQFHVDIQVDMYAFACFVTAFNDVPDFACMPWKVRETEYKKYSGKFYSGRTLSSWCRKLIEQGIMVRGSIGSYWKTYIDEESQQKMRMPVDQVEAEQYFQEKYKLLEELAVDIAKQNPKLSFDRARSEAWQLVYPLLWQEYRCCYYSCKTFHFTAWNDQGDLLEVYELTRDIADRKAKR